MLQPTESSVVYAAETKLLDLAYETAQTRNLLKVQEELQQGVNIYYWLQSLSSGGDYLTYAEREKIWRCLVSIADVYDFPTAPTLTNQPIDINVGGGGNTIINNNTYNAGTPFENNDVDSPSEVVDTIPVTDDYGVTWFYTVRKGADQRSGIITASWLSDGSAIGYSEYSTSDIGDTDDVVFSVTFSAGNIQLVATVASNDWIVSGTRYLING